MRVWVAITQLLGDRDVLLNRTNYLWSKLVWPLCDVHQTVRWCFLYFGASFWTTIFFFYLNIFFDTFNPIQPCVRVWCSHRRFSLVEQVLYCHRLYMKRIWSGYRCICICICLVNWISGANLNIYKHLKIESIFVFFYLNEFRIRIRIYIITLSIGKLRFCVVTHIWWGDLTLFYENDNYML